MQIPIRPRKIRPTVEILSQGDEISTGEVANTNAVWLAQELTQLDCRIRRHSCVPDDLQGITQLLSEIAPRVDICFSTGGLGPTTDDLTAEAVSLAFGLPLLLDPVALEAIRIRMTGRGKTMPVSNTKQAYLPQGVERLDNHWGTAPGFCLNHQGCWFVFMPGVPHEMKGMFRHWIKPRLLDAFFVTSIPRWTAFRTVGEGESSLQERTDGITWPPGVHLGFWAGDGEVKLKLRYTEICSEPRRTLLEEQVRQVLGDCLYGVDSETRVDGNLACIVGKLLVEQGLSLILLEIASAGRIAATFAGHPNLRGALTARELGTMAKLSGYGIDPFGLNPVQVATWVAREHRVDCVLFTLWQETYELEDPRQTVQLQCVVVIKGWVSITVHPLGYRDSGENIMALCLNSLRLGLVEWNRRESD